MDNQNCRLVPLPLSGAMRLLMAAVCCLIFATFTYAQVVPGTSGHNWVDTRLDIAPGTLVQLSATGEVDVGWGWGIHGPEGTRNFSPGSGYPSNAPSSVFRYGLVARLTVSRTSPQVGVLQDWSYGDTRQLCATRGGHLWLTVNDDDAGNNTGAFNVSVSQTPCRPPIEHGRFRVSIIRFKVVRPTVDDRLQRDGRGDEVFFLSRVRLIERGTIISSQDSQSSVMGDSDGHPGRIRAGTMQPGPFGGTVGGLKEGDIVPLAENVPLTMDRAPMQIFDGELTADQVLEVQPTIWEHDGSDDLLTTIGRFFNPVFDLGARSVAPLPDPEHPGLLGRILATGGDLGTDVTVGLNIFGDPKPRPIGMRLGRNSYVFVPQHLRFNFADANEASRTEFPGGDGPGVIRITYQDADALQGIYDLFVKIERL